MAYLDYTDMHLPFGTPSSRSELNFLISMVDENIQGNPEEDRISSAGNGINAVTSEHPDWHESRSDGGRIVYVGTTFSLVINLYFVKLFFCREKC